MRRPVADVIEGELVEVLALARPDGPDQPDTALVRQRKDGEEVGFVELDVEVAVESQPLAGDIGDVEDLRIAPARVARAHLLPDLRVGAVAAGDEGGVDRALGAVGAPQPGADMVALLRVPEKFRRTLHLHPKIL